MSFRDNPRKQIPLILFFGCLMPLMALNRTGRLDSIRMVDFLLIFVAGFGLGSAITRLVQMRKIVN